MRAPTRAAGSSRRAYVLCQLAGWTAYGLAGVAITSAFNRVTPAIVVTTLLGAALGGVASHLVRGRIVHDRWLELGVGALLPRLLAAVLASAFAVEFAILLAGIYVTRAYSWRGSTPGVLMVTTFNWTFTLLLWAAIYVGVRFFLRWRDAEIRRLQLEVLARDAQLDTLQAQLHPHFLFNALNVLRAMIPEDPARARDLVSEMSELMRYALQAGRRERVTLEEELSVVESYLRVESARFAERLRWRIDAGDDVRGLRLPPMLLQGLVENAVKHGIASCDAGGEVVVRASREGDRLRLRVTNPGHLGPTGGTGIGLANAAARLRLLFGENASLSVRGEPNGVVAEVVLPADGPA
jgi:signal transduction histidine kinase